MRNMIHLFSVACYVLPGLVRSSLGEAGVVSPFTGQARSDFQGWLHEGCARSGRTFQIKVTGLWCKGVNWVLIRKLKSSWDSLSRSGNRECAGDWRSGDACAQPLSDSPALASCSHVGMRV